MDKHRNDTDSILFEDQKIVPRNMEKEVKTSFIEYSMSVITSRALPDVRDRHVEEFPAFHLRPVRSEDILDLFDRQR